MIEAPINALMAVVVPRLKSDATLSAAIGDRVYDDVPIDTAFPYIGRGTSWESAENADCISGVEIGFRLDICSRAVSQAEAQRLANRVRDVLHDLDVNLAEGGLAMLEYRRTDRVPDARDPLTTRLSVEFTALIET